MDRFCPLKNILTQWRQNKGHVIKYQTVHLNILVMSHSLISLFLILAFFFLSETVSGMLIQHSY